MTQSAAYYAAIALLIAVLVLVLTLDSIGIITLLILLGFVVVAVLTAVWIPRYVHGGQIVTDCSLGVGLQDRCVVQKELEPDPDSVRSFYRMVEKQLINHLYGPQKLDQHVQKWFDDQGLTKTYSWLSMDWLNMNWFRGKRASLSSPNLAQPFKDALYHALVPEEKERNAAIQAAVHAYIREKQPLGTVVVRYMKRLIQSNLDDVASEYGKEFNQLVQEVKTMVQDFLEQDTWHIAEDKSYDITYTCTPYKLASSAITMLPTRKFRYTGFSVADDKVMMSTPTVGWSDIAGIMPAEGAADYVCSDDVELQQAQQKLVQSKYSGLGIISEIARLKSVMYHMYRGPLHDAAQSSIARYLLHYILTSSEVPEKHVHPALKRQIDAVAKVLYMLAWFTEDYVNQLKKDPLQTKNLLLQNMLERRSQAALHRKEASEVIGLRTLDSATQKAFQPVYKPELFAAERSVRGGDDDESFDLIKALQVPLTMTNLQVIERTFQEVDLDGMTMLPDDVVDIFEQAVLLTLKWYRQSHTLQQKLFLYVALIKVLPILWNRFHHVFDSIEAFRRLSVKLHDPTRVETPKHQIEKWIESSSDLTQDSLKNAAERFVVHDDRDELDLIEKTALHVVALSYVASSNRPMYMNIHSKQTPPNELVKNSAERSITGLECVYIERTSDRAVVYVGLKGITLPNVPIDRPSDALRLDLFLLTSILDTKSDRLQALVQKLTNLLENAKRENWNVVIAGHGRGATEALIVGNILQRTKPELYYRIIVFNPTFTWGLNAAYLRSSRVEIIVHHNDQMHKPLVATYRLEEKLRKIFASTQSLGYLIDHSIDNLLTTDALMSIQQIYMKGLGYKLSHINDVMQQHNEIVLADTYAHLEYIVWQDNLDHYSVELWPIVTGMLYFQRAEDVHIAQFQDIMYNMNDLIQQLDQKLFELLVPHFESLMTLHLKSAVDPAYYSVVNGDVDLFTWKYVAFKPVSETLDSFKQYLLELVHAQFVCLHVVRFVLTELQEYRTPTFNGFFRQLPNGDDIEALQTRPDFVLLWVYINSIYTMTFDETDPGIRKILPNWREYYTSENIALRNVIAEQFNAVMRTLLLRYLNAPEYDPVAKARQHLDAYLDTAVMRM
jgi:hypothetical protein